MPEGSKKYQDWYWQRVSHDGGDALLGYKKRWCWNCFWWHTHSIHFEDIGARLYVCMHCAYETYMVEASEEE